MERGWSALSYIISGIVVWGGLGYLADDALRTRPVLTIIGVLIGNAAGVYLIYLRFPMVERETSDAA